MKRKKERAKEIQTPFSELTFSQKVGYILTYYKYYFIAAILIVAVIIGVVNAYKRNNYKTDCKFAIIDGRMSGYENDEDALTKDFSKYLGIDGVSHRVICDYNLSLATQSGDQDAYYTQSKIVAMASVGDIDGYIANIDYIDYFCTEKEMFLYDLRELLTDDEMNKLADHILYYTKEDGTKIPYAVDMTDSKLKTETDLTIKQPCYGIVVTSKNTQNAVEFIRYAYDL